MILVASVPAGHPYVQGIAGPGYVALPDPPVEGAPAGQWWPHPSLEPAWVREHAEAFDLLHVHFGTEGRTEAELRALLATLREVDRPLVFTAHDLDHPHLHDRARYDAQLDLLIPGADAVLTLTDHAAAEIERRWGVQARVVPHPRLAPEPWFARADALRAERAGEPPVVAIHLRELRANVRPGAWLPALAQATHALTGAPLQIYVNERPGQVRGAGDALAPLLAALDGGAPVALHRRPRPTDDELAAELAACDVSVLPYAHGTHSGWLELCWDLGTRVLAPQVGAMAAQHRDPWFLRAFAPDEPAAVAPALAALLGAPAAPNAADRLRERRTVASANAAAHLQAYAEVTQRVATQR